jgi:hypothetical protein
MKVIWLWTGVTLAVLLIVVVLIIGREPAGGPAHSVDMPQQMQPGATTPAREAEAAGAAGRAQRGSGVEGVPSAGITVEPPQR